MKKLIVAGILALALPAVSQAQTGFKFGVKGGLNITTLSGNDLTWLEYEERFVRTSKFRPGGHAGATFSLGFGRHGNSSLTFDLLFSMKGANYSYEQNYYENETDTVTTHLEVKESVTRFCMDLPILYRYRANMGLYGEAGIFISVAAATKFNSDDPRYASTNDFNYLDIEESQYRPLDIGFTAGAGWISKGGFGIGVRGFMGLLDQYETYSNPLFIGIGAPSGRTVNLGFQFSLMYYFGWDQRSRR